MPNRRHDRLMLPIYHTGYDKLHLVHRLRHERRVNGIYEVLIVALLMACALVVGVLW